MRFECGYSYFIILIISFWKNDAIHIKIHEIILMISRAINEHTCLWIAQTHFEKKKKNHVCFPSSSTTLGLTIKQAKLKYNNMFVQTQVKSI